MKAPAPKEKKKAKAKKLPFDPAAFYGTKKKKK